jgi:hypothetical protein
VKWRAMSSNSPATAPSPCPWRPARWPARPRS